MTGSNAIRVGVSHWATDENWKLSHRPPLVSVSRADLSHGGGDLFGPDELRARNEHKIPKHFSVANEPRQFVS